MQSSNRWLVLAIVSVAIFLIVVDLTVLYTALPRLTHDLAASASEKLWIINAYPLVVAGLLPGAGTLGDRLGARRLFVWGLWVFGAASLAAAFAPTPGALIVMRGLLAVGAAMMMPATLAIIRQTFTDAHERAVAIGVWASIASGGAAIGPVMGGLLLEYFWWGSVFLINVPIVLIVLPLALWLIDQQPGTSQQPWDLTGSLQVMAGLIGVSYAIKELSKRQPSLAATAAAAAIGVAFLLIFARRQRRADAPLIDFALFRHPLFTSGVLGALVAAMALIGVQLMLTQRLQLVLDKTPLQTGLFLLPLSMGAFTAGPLAGMSLRRFSTTRVLAFSLLLAALAVFAYATLYQTGLILQMLLLALMGLGFGAAMTTASNAVMHNAPVARAGMAASIEEVSYELGGAMGVTLLGSLMSVVYTASLLLPEALTVAPTVYDSLDEALLAAETLDGQTASQLILLARGAFDRAFVAVLFAAALMLATAAIMMLRLPRLLPQRLPHPVSDDPHPA